MALILSPEPMPVDVTAAELAAAAVEAAEVVVVGVDVELVMAELM